MNKEEFECQCPIDDTSGEIIHWPKCKITSQENIGIKLAIEITDERLSDFGAALRKVREKKNIQNS